MTYLKVQLSIYLYYTTIIYLPTVVEPDDPAKVINRRQPPPVSPSKPTKTPPSPAPKSPAAGFQGKPVPSVAPKPKSKSTSTPPSSDELHAASIMAMPPPLSSGHGVKAAVNPPAKGATVIASSNGVGTGAPPPDDDLPPWKKAMRDKKLKEQEVRNRLNDATPLRESLPKPMFVY